MFYVGYLLFEVPSNLLMRRVGARRWIARIMISWGLISSLTMFARDVWTFYALRILLGIAEAGFFPGIILYLSYWFPDRERAKMTAFFMLAIGLASVFGNPISGLIMQYLDTVGGLHGWQWLFLLEGIPSVLLGFAVALLSDRLSPGCAVAVRRGARLAGRPHAHGRAAAASSGTMPIVWRRFLQWRVWLLIAIYFTVAVGSECGRSVFPEADQGAIHRPEHVSDRSSQCAAPSVRRGRDVARRHQFRSPTGERRGHLAGGGAAGRGRMEPDRLESVARRRRWPDCALRRPA